MLSIGSRVKHTQEWRDYTDIFGTVGTVTKRSPFGYLTVVWDNGVQDRFSPLTASSYIQLVTGDGALPRHNWDVDSDADNPPCKTCGVIQTDENEFEACKPEVKK